MKCSYAVGLGLSVLLLGCSVSPPSASSSPSHLEEMQSSSESPSPEQQPQPSPGQALPISAQAEIAGQTIGLEVARTSEQQEIGLMFRTNLADDRGMLFPFEPARPVQFWMRNTLIPLDMVFLLEGEVKAIAANVPPCTTSSCPTYGPGVPVNQVIELRGGRAAELGLQVGDRLAIQSLEPETNPAETKDPS